MAKAARTALPHTGVRHARPWGQRLNTATVYITLIALALVMVGIPIGWMVATALKERTQIFAYPPIYLPHPIRWQNIPDVFKAMPFLRFSLNSLFLAVMNIIGRVLSCSIVAFAFARLRFPGRNGLFVLLISTLMIPHQIVLIPQYVLFEKLGWVGTYLPLIVPSFLGHPFFIFLMRQYIMTIPRELDEAARIDGASTWDIFLRIILPLCKAPLVVIAVLTFLWSWNDFLNPLIYLTKFDDFTIQLGLNMLKQRYNVQWNLIMAGALVAVTPCIVVYFLAQKYLIGGIASVGLKD